MIETMVVFALISCKKDEVPTANCAKVDTVFFSTSIMPILNANCNLPGCHSGGNPSGNLNLEDGKAYKQLLKKGSGYVDTDAPETSVLYSSLVTSTNQMPPSGRLDECSIALIKSWMQQKAKNN